MSETFGNGNEYQVPNEEHVGRYDDLFQVAALMTEVHEFKNDVRSLHQCQDDEGPLDHGPCEGFRALEVDTHQDFHRCQQGEDARNLPDVLANLGAFFFAVAGVEGVAIVYNEVVAFHGCWG